MLNELAEKITPHALKPELVAYCPSMDLIAAGFENDHVQVFRLNGQRVFTIVNKPNQHVTHIRWKPNGRVLAIAYSDGTIRLVNSQTGKIVHSIEPAESPLHSASCLGWGVNYIEPQRIRSLLDSFGSNVDLDDVVHGNLRGTSTASPDLPAELAFLDAEAILPKLSVLPASTREDEIFASRASIDAVFHQPKSSGNESADLLVIGRDDGSIYLSIYDFFEIGTFATSQILKSVRPHFLIHHFYHPFSPSHGLLLSCDPNVTSSVFFVPLDVRLIPDSGRYISLIASKSTQLQKVLFYIMATRMHMYNEFMSSQELPRKFMRNLEDILPKRGGADLVNTMYHMVATGDCPRRIREWLVDQIGERGHKRWEKATTSGYENLRRLCHENLIPALERFGVLVSRLRGLSRFQDSNTALGVSPSEFDLMLDTLSCLNLLAHTILIRANMELRQFYAFSQWLKQEIEIQAAENRVAMAEEISEKDPALDYRAILSYVRGALLHSALMHLLEAGSSDTQGQVLSTSSPSELIYEKFKTELKRLKDDELSGSRVTYLARLLARLSDQCKAVFAKTAETQRRKVRFGDPIALGNVEPGCCDARMIISDSESRSTHISWSYVAIARNSERPFVRVQRLSLLVENGTSSPKAKESAVIGLPNGTRIQDIKFVDNKGLMLAIMDSRSSAEMAAASLAYIELDAGNTDGLGLKYGPFRSDDRYAPEEMTVDLTTAKALEEATQHTFPKGPAHAPLKLEVNGRKGRRAICVVSQNRLGYRVFDLDSGADQADPDLDRMSEGGSERG